LALSEQDKKVLEEIVELDGNCLDGRPRCQLCPFRAKCLPEFLNKTPLSKRARFDMAMKILFHNLVLEGEEDDTERKENS